MRNGLLGLGVTILVSEFCRVKAVILGGSRL